MWFELCCWCARISHQATPHCSTWTTDRWAFLLNTKWFLASYLLTTDWSLLREAEPLTFRSDLFSTYRKYKIGFCCLFWIIIIIIISSYWNPKIACKLLIFDRNTWKNLILGKRLLMNIDAEKNCRSVNDLIFCSLSSSLLFIKFYLAWHSGPQVAHSTNCFLCGHPSQKWRESSLLNFGDLRSKACTYHLLSFAY